MLSANSLEKVKKKKKKKGQYLYVTRVEVTEGIVSQGEERVET